MRFVGKTSADHAALGAKNGAKNGAEGARAASRVAPTHTSSLHACDPFFVSIDPQAPQGGAQAP